MVGSSFFSSISNYINGLSTENRHALASPSFPRHSSFTDPPRRPSPLKPLANYYNQDPLASPYSGYHGDSPLTQSNSALAPAGRAPSPRPASGHSSGGNYYSPGMRSAQAAVAATSGIPLQEFAADGSVPPAPVVDSWRRIDRWAEENYPELWDQLSYPATQADVDDLERELDCTLPRDVRESFLVHDGQERGGGPTGIFFGIPLLDCEEVIEEWNIWKFVAAEEAKSLKRGKRQSIIGDQSQQRQSSVPEAAVRRVYAHPAWIPLGKDYTGNNLAIDLAPGPNGRWGQVILFGRDQDVKYVVAKSWASLLASVANDLESGHWCIDDVSGELRLIDNHVRAEDDGFFEIMKARVRLRESRKKMMSPTSFALPRSSTEDIPSASPLTSPSIASRFIVDTIACSSDQIIDAKLISPLTASPSPSVGATSTLLSVIEETEPEVVDVPDPPVELVLKKITMEVPTISIESEEDALKEVCKLEVLELQAASFIDVDQVEPGTDENHSKIPIEKSSKVDEIISENIESTDIKP
ncbi:Cell wall biosynthesis/cell cycle regulator smi1 [Neolecta irregularis DAH-3]|uniref:Cell wall biosynthesis/cell cycle regulator smi1 n=1 Tax=Neolecta irregularis (strain DAH-3) TaxID=1198029 RepID=A0A1U7LJQ3_NEOID|nr:Cell wall biosynthesis/cell cycle regulator smi1 [Neolecta irregularis DAH-3]|eukprot:OLL22877.1 Cell wall biosynthesis/cell cycle regulator smi1 [Neolecta irregularis DAH-3]